ncbi:hypothetical protein BDZ94DRAFT_1237525 [Collybia nuda]|uniref:F-box domain-containing protein n=1 Tax=Collybia nuda TaxID=64659 RepID=A0A9P5Y3K7_9AGAR|nr:hypothetical protein BDZ94DRAFT_1237525 [Collybia nuda]
MLSENDEENLRQNLRSSLGLSNTILNDQEELIARKFLDDANSTISSIDVEIARLHSTIQSLEAQREGEMKWVERLHVGLSPQKKIPSEILGHTFEYCADDEDDYVVNIPPHPSSGCLILSQVCSRWRQVALGEPSLWNRIFINYPNAVRPDPLRTILSRAGNAIRFHITMYHIPRRVRRVIRQYSDKFQTVELTLDLSHDVQHFKIPFNQLTAVKNLRVNILNDMDDPDVPAQLYPAISSFVNAFSLQRLEIHPTIENREDNVGNVLSWARLGTADLKNLQWLKLTSHGADLNSVLSHLVAPSLRSLKIKNFHTLSDTLLQFIHRSKCNIQIIDLNLTPNLSPHIDRLIHAIPRVVTLRFRGINTLNTAALNSLSTGELLPNLEDLECYVSSCRAVRDLISNRCERRPDGSEWRVLRASLPIGGSIQVKIRRWL